MIFSKQQMFSEHQEVLATAVSTNVIDTGKKGTPQGASQALKLDIGEGTPVPINIQVTEDFAGSTSVKFAIETSDSADMSSSTVIGEVTRAVANLKKGAVIPLQYLPKQATGRYIGLRYTVTGAGTAGKVHAGVVLS